MFNVEGKTYDSQQQWLDEAVKLFGTEDVKQWRWQCPSCKRIQCTEEFKPFKDKGADPNDAYQICLGRMTGGRAGPQKCDWAAYGLFSGPHFVMNEGKKIAVFPFYVEKAKDE